MVKITRGVMFILCLNLSCWILFECSLAPSGGLQPAKVTEQMASLNSTISEVQNMNPENLVTLVTGYVWLGFTFLFRLVSWTVFGFPLLLSNLGLPTVITVPLGMIWLTLFGIFLAEFWSGRSTS